MQLNNLKMIIGTAKTSHSLLLFTSIVLITVGIYGTIVSKEFGCDSGIFVKINTLEDSIAKIMSDLSSEKILNCYSKAKNSNDFHKCLNDYTKGDMRCMEGGLMGLSITSIVIGVLMLFLSTYLLFM